MFLAKQYSPKVENLLIKDIFLSLKEILKTNLLSHIFWFLSLFLFFTMLFMPASYQLQRLPVFVLVMFGVYIKLVTRGFRSKLHPIIFIWFFLLLLRNTFFTFWGVLHNAPGAMPSITSSIIWPITAILFVSCIDSQSKIRQLIKTMNYAAVIIAGYTFYFIFHVLGYLPDSLYFPLAIIKGSGYYNGIFRYNLLNITSIIGIFPFFSTLFLFFKKENACFALNRNFIGYTVFLLLFVALLSGRRALWLIILISPLIGSLFMYFSKTNLLSIFKKIFVFYIFIFFSLTFISTLFINQFGFTLEGAVSRLISVADFSENTSNYARTEQQEHLIHYWQDKPLFGYGFGATIPSYVRSEEQPWNFELSYYAMLFQTGILGTFIFFTLILVIFLLGIVVIYRSEVHSQIMIAALTMLFCFLVANATNPYLGPFDQLWVLYLPIAIINRYLLENNHVNDSPLRKT